MLCREGYRTSAGGCTTSRQNAATRQIVLVRSHRYLGCIRPLVPRQNAASRQQKGRHVFALSALTWNDFPRIVDDLPYRRSITPPFAKGIDIDFLEVFRFLFPDGNVFTAHWTSYATLALVLAVAVELSTRLLMLLSKEPPTEEELSELEINAMKAEAREAAMERREQTQLQRERRLQMVKRVAEVRRKRLQDAKAARTRSRATRDASASGEETVPSQEDLEKGKYIFRDYIVDERYRGLNWLFVTTLMAIWVTGVLNKDSPLAP